MQYWETPRVIASCGILGILRRDGASKVRAEEALSSIECVRYRGSRYGAGFAAYNLTTNNHVKLKAFVSDDNSLQHVKNVLKEYAAGGVWELGFETPPETRFMSWAAYVEASEQSLRMAVDRINHDLMNAGLRGRVYSWGRYVEVFKGVGYPSDVCNQYRLVEKRVSADLWIAHTRQPTNSPGVYPVWSHPFASHEWAIAHNGDISSFGANMEFMNHRGVSSFVGTDSELIAYILDHLTAQMPVEKAAALMVNPFEDMLHNGVAGVTLEEYVAWRGAMLDGPFSVVAGYCDGEDVYMLAMADRSKFRPLVVGEDRERIYVASEEAEIRQFSDDAEVWPVKPGGVFLASMKKGVIFTGREHANLFYHKPRKQHPAGETVIDATGLSHTMVNTLIRKHFESRNREVSVVNVNGHRYLGINVPPHHRLNIYGTAGNCLANFNKGGEITVYGNAQDDVGDAMYGGRVVIHGDAREVVGQALQGGEIFVRGSVGNRAAIQMREFRDRKPFLIIGGRADDYLGEYMAGGVVMVLGVDALETDTCLVGRYMATGMVGGRIYVRGQVEGWRIGLQPPKPDIIRYIHGLQLEGLVTEEDVRHLEKLPYVTFGDVRARLSGEALRRVSRLFKSKYFRELKVEQRRLSEEDLELVGGVLKRFFDEFGLGEGVYRRVLREEFTVVEPVKTAVAHAEAPAEE